MKAQQVLDIMQLEKNDQYSYNRHLDSLHLKASEMISLQEEAEYKVKEKERFDIAKNGIDAGFDNLIISKMTKLSLDVIDKITERI